MRWLLVIELHSVAEACPSLDLGWTADGLALVEYDRATGQKCVPHFQWNDRQVILPPEEDEFTRHVVWPTHYWPHGTVAVASLLKQIERFLHTCIDIEKQYGFLLACFVFSSWVINDLRVAPYIALVGLPQSGKSTALRILQLICRRGMITSDISSAAFYNACERLRPTLFIDEAATAGQQKALFHLLRSGSTRDSVVFRAGGSYRTFGAKVMSFRQLPDDDALNSRCIVIPMRESLKVKLRPTDHEVLDYALILRSKLLLHRFQYSPLSRPIPEIGLLRSRNRDLYESLAYSMGDDLESATRLLKYFVDAQQSSREPLFPRETAVLETLFEQIHVHPDQANYPLKQLTQEVNSNLARSGERFRLTARAVGGILDTLGLRDRKRTALGFVVRLDRRALERTHDLMSTYGMDAPSAHLAEEAPNAPCEFCLSVRSRESVGERSRQDLAGRADEAEDEYDLVHPDFPPDDDMFDEETVRQSRFERYAIPEFFRQKQPFPLSHAATGSGAPPTNGCRNVASKPASSKEAEQKPTSPQEKGNDDVST
jgi:hypothetical protein